MTLRSVVIGAAVASASVPALAGPRGGEAADAPTPTLATIRAGLVGSWTGKLEYRDYKADRWFGLPVRVSVEMMRDGVTMISHADYDDGPKAGVVTITTVALLDPAKATEESASFRKGRATDLSTATLRIVRADAPDRWVMEALTDGRDDDRPARIRETTTRNGGTIVTLKEVDFQDDTGVVWLTRNRRTLTRQ